LLIDSVESMMMHGLANPKSILPCCMSLRHTIGQK